MTPVTDPTRGDRTRYEIVAYEPSLKSRLFPLQEYLWSPELTEDVWGKYLDWKYARNPYMDAPLIHLAMHAGEVVVTEIGTLQRAHVYHGDVLNTAARIQAKCNETGFDLLASREALSALTPDRRAGFALVAPFALRGKTEPVEVHGFLDARTPLPPREPRGVADPSARD